MWEMRMKSAIIHVEWMCRPAAAIAGRPNSCAGELAGAAGAAAAAAARAAGLLGGGLRQMRIGHAALGQLRVHLQGTHACGARSRPPQVGQVLKALSTSHTDIAGGPVWQTASQQDLSIRTSGVKSFGIKQHQSAGDICPCVCALLCFSRSSMGYNRN